MSNVVEDVQWNLPDLGTHSTATSQCQSAPFCIYYTSLLGSEQTKVRASGERNPLRPRPWKQQSDIDTRAHRLFGVQKYSDTESPPKRSRNAGRLAGMMLLPLDLCYEVSPLAFLARLN